ncbi:YfaZ family outer membrane protein [Acerihabitans sp. TG2]|uniref:YfaZ family outer membrane protein n=1 Tax=Acerihabitans sp. TG2 TaxID=3096008 RepID=UPI002B22A25E|nr:YfaZ family outer membrane protein [Acerihabitans sp. TG2]MEA9392539.1 YfaZ family outer membrane protein [Acerihabitans sp. TG2]
MKTILAAGVAASLIFVAASANAISINGDVGEHYTNIGFGFGTTTPGLALSGNWAHNDDNGDAAGLGLGYNIPFHPLMLTLGGKGMYVGPKAGDDGYAAALGGGLQLPVGSMFGLYGEYYYSPDSLSSGIESYTEANAGLRLTAIPMVTVSVGYRYMTLDGKEGHRDSVLADGPYIGGAVNF